MIIQLTYSFMKWKLMLATFISNFAIPDAKWRILEAFKNVNMSLFYNLVFSQSVYSYYHNQRHCDNFSE